MTRPFFAEEMTTAEFYKSATSIRHQHETPTKKYKKEMEKQKEPLHFDKSQFEEGEFVYTSQFCQLMSFEDFSV